VQAETIVFFLGNKTKFSLAILVFGFRSMVALNVGHRQKWATAALKIASLPLPLLNKHSSELSLPPLLVHF